MMSKREREARQLPLRPSPRSSHELLPAGGSPT
ncbi:hypothetical protein JOF53_001124 [Crossiella equi]|uniref:Uncharacterized protein n=1 Tax=Crossiella equi TaxID=130796 RepID=A0ABS5A6N1_9PSEU|nr:hypothetical protein [Crossiella equi]